MPARGRRVVEEGPRVRRDREPLCVRALQRARGLRFLSSAGAPVLIEYARSAPVLRQALIFLVINTALEHRPFPMKLRSWPSSKLRKKTMSIGLIFPASVFPMDNMLGALSLCLYCGAEAISELISEMDLCKNMEHHKNAYFSFLRQNYARYFPRGKAPETQQTR